MRALITFMAFISIAMGACAGERADKKLAMEYLEIGHFEETINVSYEALVRQSLGQVPDEMRARVLSVYRETIGWNAIKGKLADVVAETYTTDELIAYIAFSKTKLGKSYNDKTPVFSDRFSEIIAKDGAVAALKVRALLYPEASPRPAKKQGAL